MLLPSRKPSSSYSLLKFVYVTSQLCHISLVVHPLLRKILDPPLVKYYYFVFNVAIFLSSQKCLWWWWWGEEGKVGWRECCVTTQKMAE